ncbi:MAG: hypothetical protein LBM41_03335, partial [Ruminococcus sp.]|nr:hypothetical protein [Ruminococcus sp.]
IEKKSGVPVSAGTPRYKKGTASVRQKPLSASTAFMNLHIFANAQKINLVNDNISYTLPQEVQIPNPVI